MGSLASDYFRTRACDAETPEGALGGLKGERKLFREGARQSDETRITYSISGGILYEYGARLNKLQSAKDRLPGLRRPDGEETPFAGLVKDHKWDPVYDELEEFHREAVDYLAKLAARAGLDAAPIMLSGSLCRRFFGRLQREQIREMCEHDQVLWPECLLHYPNEMSSEERLLAFTADMIVKEIGVLVRAEKLVNCEMPTTPIPAAAVLVPFPNGYTVSGAREPLPAGLIIGVQPNDPPPEQVDAVARAIALMLQAYWKGRKIKVEALVKMVGRSRSTLYRDPQFMAARTLIRGHRQERPPRGHKGNNGHIEAEANCEED